MSVAHRILVVDDTEANRQLYKAILCRAGFDVTLAQDGPEALARIAEGSPSLVLLDYMMPGMNGADVLIRIRANDTTHELPVVVLTASEESETIEASLASGANDYMTKPIDGRILVARLRSIIRANQAPASAPAEAERDRLREAIDEGRRIQAAQLPPVPALWPPWRILGTVVPSGQIAGDVFDIVETPDGRLIALVVDVSGHGIASALVAAETRSELRALLASRSLLDSIGLMNRRLNQRDTGKYACIAAIEVGPRGGQAINAGLPPIAQIRGGSLIRTFSASGLPLGLFPHASYGSEAFDARLGDRLAILSDGITEPFGPADDVEGALERLDLPPPAAWLKHEMSAEGLGKRVREVARGNADELADDATLVLLERV